MYICLYLLSIFQLDRRNRRYAKQRRWQHPAQQHQRARDVDGASSHAWPTLETTGTVDKDMHTDMVASTDREGAGATTSARGLYGRSGLEGAYNSHHPYGDVDGTDADSDTGRMDGAEREDEAQQKTGKGKASRSGGSLVRQSNISGHHVHQD